MNKRAQQQPQTIPEVPVAHPSYKKIIILAIIAVVIIALAITAYFMFKPKAALPEVPAEEASAEQTLQGLSEGMTPEEKQAAEETLNSLSQDLTPEERQNAEDVLNSL